jgi:hypothetical protein
MLKIAKSDVAAPNHRDLELELELDLVRPRGRLGSTVNEVADAPEPGPDSLDAAPSSSRPSRLHL